MNGILADEMGLGKTIQTIALLAHLACNKGIWGPHLIIVPTSILINWEIEFKKWCPAFKIMTYYGSPKERKQKRQGWSKLNHFQVCITTYKIALQDQKIFRRKKWYFMVLDEAQNIKNFKSQRWQVLLNFNTKHRLLLTGTPLQNDVGELWSLLHFLMPKTFDSHADFMEWFSIPMQQALQKNLPISQEILTQLHSILRPFLLRRMKRDVEKQLPTKTEYIIKCPLSRRQKYLYDEFISREQSKSQDFLGLMNIVMQLKKVCNHPDLFESRTIESPFISLRIHYVVLAHFICNIQTKIPYFLIFINNEVNRSKYNIEKINKARINGDFVIYGRDLVNFLSLKKKKNPYQALSQFKISQTFEQTFDSVKGLIKEFTFSQKAIAQQIEIEITPYNSMIKVKLIQFFFSIYFKKNNYDYQNKIISNNLQKITKLFHYPHIRQTLCFPSKKLLMYDCGKLNSMVQLLKKLKQKGDKVLIFTQMSKMLDIFENVLNLFNFTYVRLDGSTKIENRQKVVERFNGDPKIFCFISSTRSGGIGINLTGANAVVFYDTDWNPAMDKQAQDRCHRIGQTRNVSIYRLISEYTIEENILLKSLQKRKLDEYIMEEGMFTTQFFEKFDVRSILGEVLGNKNNQDYNEDDCDCDYSEEFEEDEEKMDEEVKLDEQERLDDGEKILQNQISLDQPNESKLKIKKVQFIEINDVKNLKLNENNYQEDENSNNSNNNNINNENNNNQNGDDDDDDDDDDNESQFKFDENDKLNAQRLYKKYYFLAQKTQQS
ncbi:snf2 family n-terminal domain protein [Ichthyophthirius multifiliis]|uniref:Snf2 family n-terminal domain protein n=1 Tax=Ichthyophthirius multifiliis TaxID=5932 RepID=G0QZV7_ICHMU|nr:snf2 family n-terminal domain protein [Ichthyophthirius multifiliis]EGR29252.1 snf2 family n-terminal domain protein [Ichthyophthirius multifiliis]|eukprot:XP_004030488.1 snf2 family n-terminal domain protein [Ichthyophthirius multifiliis]